MNLTHQPPISCRKHLILLLHAYSITSCTWFKSVTIPESVSLHILIPFSAQKGSSGPHGVEQPVVPAWPSVKSHCVCSGGFSGSCCSRSVLWHGRSIFPPSSPSTPLPLVQLTLWGSLVTRQPPGLGTSAQGLLSPWRGILEEVLHTRGFSILRCLLCPSGRGPETWFSGLFSLHAGRRELISDSLGLNTACCHLYSPGSRWHSSLGECPLRAPEGVVSKPPAP